MTKLIISAIDKANHFIVGYLLYFVVVLAIPPLYAFILTAFIGFLKELNDMFFYKKSFDLADFIYTVFGAIPIFILNIIQ